MILQFNLCAKSEIYGTTIDEIVEWRGSYI